MKFKYIELMWITIVVINLFNIGAVLFNFINSIKIQYNYLKNKKENDLSIYNLDAEFSEEYVQTQLEKVRKRNVIRVAIVNNKAYWVHNNTFYEAEVIDGSIQNEKAKQIDAHNLSQKELNTLLDILDNIS